MVEPTRIFDHERHQVQVAEEEELRGVFPVNQSCAVCHTAGKAKTATSAKSCLECHGDDTGWKETDDPTANLTWAVSYLEAMHGTCAGCHEEEAQKEGRTELRDCSTCHKSLEPRAYSSQALAAEH
jgi:mono/diheme cytochrome c family protein